MKSNIMNGILSIMIGCIVGVFTVFGQKYLPGSFNSLANSGAVWIIFAFYTSLLLRKTMIKTIAICINTLIFCVLSYYWFESIINMHTFQFGDYYILLWLACAVVGGTIFGYGAYRHNKSEYWLDTLTSNLLPAVFLSEGINKIIHIEGYMHMLGAVWGTVIIGICLYFLLNRKKSFQKRQMSSILLLTGLGLLGFEILFQLTV
ncbi:hypothetical protein BJV85_000575 [Clostridium acetobutylicum]|uniref:Predicted membrane protein n=1 Tax=Clostridium acetobutylicum (strain ATCC 824 / DSM 792 / JCM 1419 / IAM 19013 / LMG 5710 / NBRC 13948 / NRRL B-527 / VKM B-1787 / 2291 / W) TaxID=272562 RepID=Q97DZ2_CLOAB|nr:MULTISPECIES: DUF6518 family protein [Clostridium]AAK81260.1 Predicted membrane protein [Clostridium acetobutylicum ATCC 824]ADZ22368.1 membrane protein [Clostridium acetobutylicum EA 2018]AEI32773.1 hypothetical protein SMB_G3365 [Clostridium acetobutylicum DSM 1731]AWV81072.1 hypothetical protein DK921_13370 [Clostridium acetobutylicum]MBC2395588.1 hypothetical protein [Clostridium acetobutylicum]